MILSSADILRVLGGSEIIRLSAKLKVVDGKPPLSGAEGLFVYIDRFPKIDEFQATWSIYVESDGSEPDDLVLGEIKRLLPSVKIVEGLLTTVTTTDFISESTQRAPEVVKASKAQVDLTDYEERFQALAEDVQDRMLLIGSGRPGKDGADGKDGVDGRDGKDLEATDVSLFDLSDVESGIPLKKGQVLMWDGSEWTNLYVPQVSTLFAGGGGGDGEGVIISDTPPGEREDGSALEAGDQWWDSSTGVMYVWYVDGDGGQWVQSSGGEGGGSSTLTGLLDTNITTPTDGQVLSYDEASGDWVNADAPAAGLQSGDNISELVNDAGYITSAEAPVQPDDLFSGDYNDLTNQPSIPSATSELVNDSGFITLEEVPVSGVEEAPEDDNYYVRQNGQWVSLVDALYAIDDKAIDGGDLETGISTGGDTVVDGGVIT